MESHLYTRPYVPEWTICLPTLYMFSSINGNLPECLIFINQVIVGRRHVGIMSAEPVGNYGVRYLRLKLCVRIFILVYADANFSHKRAHNVKYGDGVIWVDDSGWFSMICIKLEYTHGIFSTILAATSLRWWEITSKH